MKKYLIEIIIEKTEEGYFAYCPMIQGCYTQGDTYEDAIKNIKDAVKLHLEDRIKDKQSISVPESISVTTLEVTV